MFPHWRFADPVSPIPLQIALPFSHFFLALLSSILLLFLYVGVFFWAIHFLPPPSQRRRMREWREREPPKKVGGELSQKLLWPFFFPLPSLISLLHPPFFHRISFLFFVRNPGSARTSRTTPHRLRREAGSSGGGWWRCPGRRRTPRKVRRI